jgi:hypothetical protein
MPRKHAVAIAVLLAFNAVVATVALSRTVHLGQPSHKASHTLIAKRTSQLDRFEASLKAQLAKKPPPLPKQPKLTPVPVAASAPAASATPQVRYVRPAPIIIHKHRPGGEHEAEGGGSGDGGDGDGD